MPLRRQAPEEAGSRTVTGNDPPSARLTKVTSMPQAVQSRRVLITGGSGFIGTNAVEAFLRDGATVVNVDVAPPKDPSHAPNWQNVDILNKARLEQSFRSFRPDLVVHLAAKTVLDERATLALYAANIQGVQNVIDAVQAAGCVERTFFASSRLVCRLGYVPKDDVDYQPSTLYGLSKVRGEQLVRAAPSGLGTWTILRPTGIWGPWFGVPYRDFFMTIRRGRYVNPARRDAHKSYGYVENTVYELQRLAACWPSDVHGKTFVVADYPPVSVKSWATLIQEALGARQIRSVPVPLLNGAAIAGDVVERLGLGHAPLTSFRLNNLVSDMVYDTSSLEALVGPLPYTLAQGVKRTVAWLESRVSEPVRNRE
jgi:nucleoside-diphosphate-sugar epimerase